MLGQQDSEDMTTASAAQGVSFNPDRGTVPISLVAQITVSSESSSISCSLFVTSQVQT